MPLEGWIEVPDQKGLYRPVWSRDNGTSWKFPIGTLGVVEKRTVATQVNEAWIDITMDLLRRERQAHHMDE